MRRMRRSRPVPRAWMAFAVTSALTPLACEAPLTSDPGPALDVQTASASTARRAMMMRGTVVAVGEVNPPPAGCAVYFNTSIRLQATHLGRVEGVGATCVLSLTPDPAPPFVPPAPPPYLVAPFEPRWVLTAANGDQLRLEGFASIAVLAPGSNALRARGKMRIVGGTGRFAGATGELDAAAVNDGSRAADDFEARGWIRY